MSRRNEPVLAVCVPLALTRMASAEEAPAVAAPGQGTGTAPSVDEERARQRYQLSLGVQRGFDVAPGNGGGLGGGPMTTADLAIRLGGPAWLVLEAHGGVASDEGYGVSSLS